ncbi:hypothetical protein EPK99_13050 [Neorhizobium lilium]|uniref:Uncharacterized protein n=1 Tax=Neorhizobium lilium TaxID=2503024 RepID=A0A3S3RFU8_9HYPH|nr:hypothetical protein [Neorhizobium lilium]RWX76610.1 hypothetical protein EPK99_13050 [Neorhizobium lilium]
MPTQMVRHPVNPDQLNILQKVFDETCAEHQIEKDSPDAEALALILVNSLQKGSSEIEQLSAIAEALAKNR